MAVRKVIAKFIVTELHFPPNIDLRHSLKRPGKISNLLAEVQFCLENGRYRDTSHAIQRKQERRISMPDIIRVLKHGKHEQIKDTYSEVFKSWNYAIRAKQSMTGKSE